MSVVTPTLPRLRRGPLPWRIVDAPSDRRAHARAERARAGEGLSGQRKMPPPPQAGEGRGGGRPHTAIGLLRKHR